MSDFLSRELDDFSHKDGKEAGKRLAGHLLRERQVGDLLKLDYNEATIVVHDKMRRDVGGLPLGCFLVATRLDPGSAPPPEEEDTSLILLRVLGPSPLPNQTDTDRDRFEAARRAADRTQHWDDQTTTDQFTLNLLRFAGLRCRVLGTFLLKQVEGKWQMCFGPDLANFYSGKGMKVYKPDPQLLSTIVNYVTPQTEQRPGGGHRILVGRTRYAASERPGDDTAATRVQLDPSDLLARRTALFGMSRTGKSNTTKIIAAAVFGLRQHQGGLRVGQLILDPNGEYANDNAQDKGSLRGVAGHAPGEVRTYGLTPHPNDPGRQIIKLNFFGNEPTDWNNGVEVTNALGGLIQGKEILDNLLAGQTAQYVSAFRALRFTLPEDWDAGGRTRYKRLIAVYRAILSEHLTPPPVLAQARISGLTNDELRRALLRSERRASAAAVLSQKAPVPWGAARDAWRHIWRAIKDEEEEYTAFNRDYIRQSSEGRDWHDTPLLNALNFLDQPGGMKLVSQLKAYHHASSTTDYADDIVRDLHAGRLVIVDQSTGDPEMNKTAAERLMWRIFNAQLASFIEAKPDGKGGIIPPSPVMVYVEEAHNLLPAKSDDLTKIWSRVAKEGSKFRIGLVYATQEPSSIQANILKNTDNWFVAHLNNADELRELKKYYDFEDFAQQILTVPEPGFLRMRTLSNPYTVPVQVNRFDGAPRAV